MIPLSMNPLTAPLPGPLNVVYIVLSILGGICIFVGGPILICVAVNEWLRRASIEYQHQETLRELRRARELADAGAPIIRTAIEGNES